MLLIKNPFFNNIEKKKWEEIKIKLETRCKINFISCRVMDSSNNKILIPNKKNSISVKINKQIKIWGLQANLLIFVIACLNLILILKIKSLKKKMKK